MNTAPLPPDGIADSSAVTLRSPADDDLHNPAGGARAHARTVYLGGSDLPSRWQGRRRFVVLEAGFGFGHNFLATWAAWRDDPARCDVVHFISIEAAPLTRDELAAMARQPALAPLAAQLVVAWPPLTWNLHRLSFEGGAVQLLLAFGDVDAWLPQISARVDAFYLDGFTPAGKPATWQPRLFKAMARLCAAGATVVATTASAPVRAALASAGFDVRAVPGQGGECDVTSARFAPRFAPRPSRTRPQSAAGDPAEPVVVVGAGLAGCATAWALAEQGRSCVLLERRDEIAGEASGNAAGLFHGVVHRSDGRHARFHRAGALAAREVVAAAVAAGVRGSTSGLLRLAPDEAGHQRIQGTIDRLGLPADYVRAVAADEASALAGVPLSSPAWHYPQGGWVDPRGLARWFLEQAGARASVHHVREVATLRRDDDGWQLLDATGATLSRSRTVVLANGIAALRLLGEPGWPIESVRGQVSSWPASCWPDGARLRLPVAGAGYVLPAIDGTIWFGASTQSGDADATVRTTDGDDNVRRLALLIGSSLPVSAAAPGGRTGFRAVSADRLPVIGAAPVLAAGLPAVRMDHPRFVPREPGLFVIMALGSRGIASAAIGGRVVAAAVCGLPAPLEVDLLDAIDPARFASRAARRGAMKS
ncbi:MAG: FAD-dependent 5-carboxymethylaminomethyl-2-thiouridine(34) oxidoreductase MnmC [Caldimonas sp.]